MLEPIVELTVALDQDSRMVPSFSSKILGSRMGRTLLLFGVKKFSSLWEEKVQRHCSVPFYHQRAFLYPPSLSSSWLRRPCLPGPCLPPTTWPLAHCALTTLSLPFLQQVELFPASGPFYLLFSLPREPHGSLHACPLLIIQVSAQM